MRRTLNLAGNICKMDEGKDTVYKKDMRIFEMEQIRHLISFI